MTSTATTARIRVPRRAWVYIEGTQAWADRKFPERQDAEDRATAALWQRIADAPERQDGSVTVEMSPEERETFLDYATAWVCGAQDNAGPDDMDALSDLNSLRALIRRLSA